MDYPQLAFIDLKKQYEHIKDDLSPRLDKVLGNAAFIGGSEVKELEQELQSFTGVKHVISCANGTDALQLVLMAWDIRPGDAVFCPAFTFIATSEVVSLRGGTPVFVDVDPVTFNMDARDLERKIDNLRRGGEYIPRAVISVDLFGLPADYQAINEVAKAHGLLLLEDAAQGFGGRIGDKLAGNFGDAAATSFFPAKPLGCYGDGGAVFTSDPSLMETIASIKSHGAGSHKYEHVRIGLNSRLDTLQAAILLSKLKVFPKELLLRKEKADNYNKLLHNVVETPLIPDGYTSAYAQYTVKVAPDRRDKIISFMKSKGVPTMIYYPLPLHLQMAYRAFGGRRGDCPVAEKLSGEVLSLPMHPYLTNEDQEQVADALKSALES